jgi:3-dehydroquinate synthase
VVGVGLLDRVADRLESLAITAASRVLIVADANVAAHAARVHRSLSDRGFRVWQTSVNATEEGKAMPAVESIWSAALAARLTRHDLIVAVGGGLVGDVAGFAAAAFLRGMRWVTVPTTLLAMVDASTGGKTGINLRLPSGSLGKNLAGAFWPPLEVIADPETLTTLAARELRSGLAEVIKHAIIESTDHVALVESMPLESIATQPIEQGSAELAQLAKLIEKSVAVKARIVTQDPREQGLRALLNFGHTFGHALETEPGCDLTHGEAVALGMVAACHVGQSLRGFPAAQQRRVEELIRRAGLPVRLDPSVTVAVADIEGRMQFDKKAERELQFVIPAAIGQVEAKVAVPSRLVREALAAIGCVA